MSDVIYIRFSDDNVVPVFKDPGHRDYMTLKEMHRCEFFTYPRPGTPYVRSTYDESGSFYVWPALHLHSHIVPKLEDIIGMKTDQAWYDR